jgi:hypothetical protein
MKCLSVFVLTFLFFTTLLTAQSANAPLMSYIKGEVWYTPATGAKARVYTIGYLIPPGTLTLGAGASVGLNLSNEYVELKQPGEYELLELFGQGGEADGFLTKFSRFIRQGLDQSESAKKLENAYQQNQSNAQGNTRGFGDKGMYGIRPFGGTLSKGITYFTWQENTEAEYYEFRLIDSTSEDLVMMALTRGPAFLLSTADLILENGKTYYWEVFPVTPAKTTEKPSLGMAKTTADPLRIHFTYSPQNLTSLLTPLQTSEPYRKLTDPVQQKLMEAMELEDNDFLYDAYQTYATALADNTDSLILRRTFAAFLARWNLRREAEGLLVD